MNNWTGTAVEYQRLLEEIKWRDFDAMGTAAQEFNEYVVSKKGAQIVPRVVEEAWLSRGALTAIAVAGVVVGVSLLRIWRQTSPLRTR